MSGTSIVKGVGVAQMWGFSPAIDLVETFIRANESAKLPSKITQQDTASGPLSVATHSVLMLGSSDLRHVLKTLYALPRNAEALWALHNGGSAQTSGTGRRVVHVDFYLSETSLECLTRQLLLWLLLNVYGSPEGLLSVEKEANLEGEQKTEVGTESDKPGDKPGDKPSDLSDKKQDDKQGDKQGQDEQTTMLSDKVTSCFLEIFGNALVQVRTCRQISELVEDWILPLLQEKASLNAACASSSDSDFPSHSALSQSANAAIWRRILSSVDISLLKHKESDYMAFLAKQWISTGRETTAEDELTEGNAATETKMTEVAGEAEGPEQGSTDSKPGEKRELSEGGTSGVVSYASAPDRLKIDIAKLRDHRLRNYYGARYDVRKNLIDWDYYEYIREVCSIVHVKEYMLWRLRGIAFEDRFCQYTADNRTLFSYRDARHKKRGSVQVAGYWGDVVVSPHMSFGLEGPVEEWFKVRSGQQISHAGVVARKNVSRWVKQIFLDWAWQTHPLRKTSAGAPEQKQKTNNNDGFSSLLQDMQQASDSASSSRQQAEELPGGSASNMMDLSSLMIRSQPSKVKKDKKKRKKKKKSKSHQVDRGADSISFLNSLMQQADTDTHSDGTHNNAMQHRSNPVQVGASLRSATETQAVPNSDMWNSLSERVVDPVRAFEDERGAIDISDGDSTASTELVDAPLVNTVSQPSSQRSSQQSSVEWSFRIVLTPTLEVPKKQQPESAVCRCCDEGLPSLEGTSLGKTRFRQRFDQVYVAHSHVHWIGAKDSPDGPADEEKRRVQRNNDGGETKCQENCASAEEKSRAHVPACGLSYVLRDSAASLMTCELAQFLPISNEQKTAYRQRLRAMARSAGWQASTVTPARGPFSSPQSASLSPLSGAPAAVCRPREGEEHHLCFKMPSDSTSKQ